MNSLSVTEQETIFGPLRLGWSERRISRETGHHRGTVRRCARELAELRAAELAGGEVAADAKPPVAVEPRADRGGMKSNCAPHAAFIESEPVC